MFKKLLGFATMLVFSLVASAASAGTWTAPVNSSTQPVTSDAQAHSIAAGAGVTNFNNPQPTTGYCPTTGVFYQYYTITYIPPTGAPGGIIRPGRIFLKFYYQVCQ